MDRKKRRVNVTTACANCQRFHTSCENERPCQKCVERGRPCEEGIARKRGRKKTRREGNVSAGVKEESSNSVVDGNVKEEVLNWSGSEDNWGSPEPVSSPMYEWSEVSLDMSTLLENIKNFQEIPQEPFYGGVPDRNETPSNFSRLEYVQFTVDYLNERFPSSTVHWEKNMTKWRTQLASIRESISKEVADKIWEDFNGHLVNLSSLFSQLGTPSIIWELSGIVHYVNDAYKEMTGFSQTVPTLLSDLTFLSQLDNLGLVEWFEVLKKVMQISQGYCSNTFTFPTGLKVRDRYVKGTFCVTIKRDTLGLPLVFYGNFLPNL